MSESSQRPVTDVVLLSLHCDMLDGGNCASEARFCVPGGQQSRGESGTEHQQKASSRLCALESCKTW